MARAAGKFQMQLKPGILQGMKDTFRSVIEDVFENDIKPEAVQNSPIDTGTNSRSVDVEIKTVATGVLAEIYTQSGYGGYLEVGTIYMAARPYMYPAFELSMPTLSRKLQGSIDKVR